MSDSRHSLGSPFDDSRLAPPRASQDRRASGERSRKPPPATPHDHILSDLFEDLDSAAQSSTSPTYAPLREPLRDPYDGTTVGVLHAPDGSSADTSALWTHFGRVLELQGAVARAHGEMEGLGAKPKAEGKPAQQRPWVRAETARLSGLPTTTTASPAKGGEGLLGPELTSGRRTASAMSDAGDDDAVGEDEGVSESRAREVEFASLAQQFSGRRDAIAGIMGQLDELSKALTEFHALQAPKVEFPPSSRNGSMPAPAESPRPKPRRPSTSADFDRLAAAKALQDETGPGPRQLPSLMTHGLGTQEVFVDSPHSTDMLRTPSGV
ncbi:hypothetical protein BD626DRAFT_486704 [Schizophyllum amplum]|uniref:Uncharacterized protein n=1 Tax=Schizophyllum amplum TaxID=97359 RepID=A0A550CMS1_9AGAR|nr:hypothetical protein BD626DRAFT_486704 [Auriculariopsis ampla]